MTPKEFSAFSPSLPRLPGIYKYFNNDHQVIYVGKAKNIFKRVSSYFTKTFTSAKTAELVRHIHSIEFTVVNSEADAFFLENSLIKEHQPKYNINLKDDKSYPFIVIKNEAFPRVFLTRKKIRDGSEYLGPFTSVLYVRELLEFIRQNIPIRSCSLNLSPKNIQAGKYKVCLEYHLGNCKGPCAGLQTAVSYHESLQQIKDILKGKTGEVIKEFKKEMAAFAGRLDYERAEILKKKIEHLQHYQAKSTVVNARLNEADVFTITMQDEWAFINYMAVNNGAIIQTKTITAECRLDEDAAEVLVMAIASLRETFASKAKELIVPFAIEYPEQDVNVTVPKAGDRKKLIDLSYKNVLLAQDEWKRKKILHLKENKEQQQLEALELLQQDLQLQDLPVHIECFDNSHFQGSYYVSAMVCFRNGIPSKQDYRKFNIKTVKGIDDFAAMKEAVYRRYKRLTDEQKELPQLVIIDGGKGQLNAAMESISELGLQGRMTLIGIAKNEEEVFFSGDSASKKLNWKGSSLNLVRQIRDEVHRFVITFHRSKRSKGAFVNELEQIMGIGKATADQLLQQFRSVTKIRELSLEELEKVTGKAKASVLYNALHKKGAG